MNVNQKYLKSHVVCVQYCNKDYLKFQLKHTCAPINCDLFLPRSSLSLINFSYLTIDFMLLIFKIYSKFIPFLD